MSVVTDKLDQTVGRLPLHTLLILGRRHRRACQSTGRNGGHAIVWGLGVRVGLEMYGALRIADSSIHGILPRLRPHQVIFLLKFFEPARA